MKKALLLGLFIAIASPIWGQVPQTMSYQGILTDASGGLVADGNYSLTFRIYDASTGGNQLWTETQASVSVSKGIFSVILGSISPLSVPFDKSYWLGVAVGGGSELSPRITLTASPYSLNARSIADNAVTGGKIASGQVVKSLNSLTDNVTLAAGTNTSISASGNTLTIAAVGGTPAGAVMAFAGSAAPIGWLICDGSAVSRTTYADLFSAIGTTYGAGDGSTTFNLPNLKGKVPVGYNSTETEFDALGKTGGEKKHTLTTIEMPSHTHQARGSDVNDGQGGYLANKYWASSGSTGWNTSANLNLAAGAIANTGGDQPHNIMQPYIALNFIIKM